MKMKLFLLGLGGILVSGCAEVNRTSAQAQTGAPVSAQVPVVSIPYDPNLPRFVVVVEPFGYGASGITSGMNAPTAPYANGGALAPITGGGLQQGGYQGNYYNANPQQNYTANHPAPGQEIGVGLAAQMTTALSNWPNVSVLDPSGVFRNPDGTLTAKLQQGEIGPFVVRGTVTEFNETADLADKTRGGSLGGVGAALGIAGAVSGSPALGYTGLGIAAANPTYQNQKMTRKGMVGMDLQLFDGRTSRIVRGYNSSGTFVTESATSGLSLFGIGGGDAQFAASALGQATRAAMNDAVTKTADALRVAPR